MQHEPHEVSAGTSDESAGRTATADELPGRLPRGSPAFLRGALDNPCLGEAELMLLIRNPGVDAPMLSRIGRESRWIRRYEVKAALVRHPRTPHVIGLTLLHHLRWVDLAEAARDLQVHPVVRRGCERLVATRVESLGTGEQVALARRASRGLIPRLLASDDARVLAGLLGNPRLVEGEVRRLASGAAAPPELLGALARHHRWGQSRGVGFALLRNGRTPIADALHVVGRLAADDLRRLTGDDKVPMIVRVGARRRLERFAGTAVRSRPEERSGA